MLFSLGPRIRNELVGKAQDFTFYSAKGEEIELPKSDKIDIYIHIPFCKSMCPYCPYNRIKYDRKKVDPYVNALLKEIEMYGKRMGKIRVGSIYIGGGTPTNLIDELAVVLKKVEETFIVEGDIALETSVYDINRYNVEMLKKMGVTQISIGVQSFDDKFLQFLGRNYKESDIVPVVEMVKSFKFESVNIDLMFALPGQRLSDVFSDLEKAIKLGVDQITVYPLFTFPYSTVGKYRRMKKLKMPNPLLRRKMYYTIYDYLESRGYNRVSVWGFKRGESPEYSSVTRERYIGFGAGAATYSEKNFYFNTFSVTEYGKSLKEKHLPISLDMKIEKPLADYYWLYWRLYEGEFDIRKYRSRFSDDSKTDKIIGMMIFLGLLKRKGHLMSLSKRGAFWVHLVQNYFMLDYINKVWTVSMKKAWPEKIEI